jgi:hypothetical protein
MARPWRMMKELSSGGGAIQRYQAQSRQPQYRQPRDTYLRLAHTRRIYSPAQQKIEDLRLGLIVDLTLFGEEI